MRSLVEKIVDRIIAERKKLIKMMASETYARELRMQQKSH